MHLPLPEPLRAAIHRLTRLLPFPKLSVSEPARINLTKLRGRRGEIHLGRGSMVNARIAFDRPEGAVVIGSRTFIGNSFLVCASRITIGDDVLISWGVTIVDHNSHSLYFAERRDDNILWWRGEKVWDNVKISEVNISDKVWIGFGASILKGVTIGEGAVIGAGSVVTKDVPPWTVVAGNPATVIKTMRQIS
jgi:acetyltransferase-like isoleucine patch superfamily enzyme